MNRINIFFDEEINNRIDEFAKLKKIIHSSFINDEVRTILISSSVALIYAHWEGFVKNSFQFYINEVNNEKLGIEQIHINYLAHDIDRKYQLSNSRNHIEAKIKFTGNLLEYFDNPIDLSVKVDTESNINLKVINKILLNFNMILLDEKYEKGLNKLLKFRNDVAHGDFGIEVSSDHIDQFSLLVQCLMNEIYTKIQDALENKKYLRD